MQFLGRWSPRSFKHNLFDIQRVDRAFALVEDRLFPELLMALPSLAYLYPDRAGKMNRLIERDLLSLAPRTVASALNAVFWTTRRLAVPTVAVSQDVIAEIVTICRTGRQSYLHWAVEFAALLVKSGLVADTDSNRLVNAVEILERATTYVVADAERLADSDLIRRAALRLAIALKDKRFGRASTISWIEHAGSEPMPEVRYPLSDPEDD